MQTQVQISQSQVGPSKRVSAFAAEDEMMIDSEMAKMRSRIDEFQL